MMWHDGKWVDQAQVAAFSHGLNYSCGVFDTARLYETPEGPAFFRLDEHVRRLFGALKFAGFSTRFTPIQIMAAVKQLVRKNNLTSAYVRMNAFLPQEQLRVFPESRNASLVIVAAPLHYSGKTFDTGLLCHLSSFRKPPADVIPAGIKFSANYLSAYLALKEARMKGFDEAILSDSRGYIAEASAQNLFLAKNGVLYTPSTRSEILPGITRDTVMGLARDLGIRVQETDLSVREMLAADEIFLTGTATEIMPITRIGRKRFSIGPLSRTLNAAFFDAVHGHHGFSKKWLEYV